MSFANSEILPNIATWFQPLVGILPYQKKSVDDASAKALKAVHVLEQHFLVNTYLVGERLTLADIFVTSLITRGFQYLFDKQFRSSHPNVTRWYETIYNQPIYSAEVPKLEFIDEAVKYNPPKKEPAPKKEAALKKETPKKVEKEVEDEEEDASAAPKAKHPLEALSKPTLILDDWKRKYSNEETREVALPWFWENFKPDEYSLWRLDYKYNDELTMTFMTSNLIGKSSTCLLKYHCSIASIDVIVTGGFFTRLEASRKYIFGAASVYGVANDSAVQGAFVIRGQDAAPAFDVAPDFESYEFTKLDPSIAEDKAFVEDQWSWDKPITINGKEMVWADGKVFK